MRWPLQPLQPLQQTQLQPPFGQSVDSLCHPWFTTTNVSYRFPILKLPPPPCAVLLVYIYIICRTYCSCVCSMYICTILSEVVTCPWWNSSMEEAVFLFLRSTNSGCLGCWRPTLVPNTNVFCFQFNMLFLAVPSQWVWIKFGHSSVQSVPPGLLGTLKAQIGQSLRLKHFDPCSRVCEGCVFKTAWSWLSYAVISQLGPGLITSLS